MSDHVHGLRLALLVLLLSVAGPVSGEPTSERVRNEGAEPKWCRVCHQGELFSAKSVAASAHADLTCIDCHEGYHFDPHEPVTLYPDDPPDALLERESNAPHALALCVTCHEPPADEPGAFSHGNESGLTSAELPYCLECHGEPHSIALLETLTPRERRLEMNARCLACHDDPERMEAHEVSTGVAESYANSMHSIKLILGSEESPGCADCHGGHELVDLEKDRVQTCGACHEHSNESFASLATHAPWTADSRPVGYYIKKVFAWLTFITIFLLALHVLFDLLASLRGLASRRRETVEPTSEAEEPTILRFDIHQRLQHALLATTFVLLVLTGWPLSTHGIPASRWLISLFGGLEGCGQVHRWAAVGLVVMSLYHLGYLIVRWRQGRLALSTFPRPKDFRDLYGNVLYFFGLRKTRPRFPRYSYFEKFDYWAVFWGVVVMAGSGFVRWFPDQVTRIAPAWLHEASYVAHAEEALLAAMAIFIWHFYNVHLRPAIFPMSWVFLTGRLTRSELEHEHGEEFDELVAKGLLPKDEPSSKPDSDSAGRADQ